MDPTDESIYLNLRRSLLTNAKRNLNQEKWVKICLDYQKILPRREMYQMSKTLCPEALLEELENRLVIFVKSPRVQTDLCSESNIKALGKLVNEISDTSLTLEFQNAEKKFTMLPPVCFSNENKNLIAEAINKQGFFYKGETFFQNLKLTQDEILSLRDHKHEVVKGLELFEKKEYLSRGFKFKDNGEENLKEVTKKIKESLIVINLKRIANKL